MVSPSRRGTKRRKPSQGSSTTSSPTPNPEELEHKLTHALSAWNAACDTALHATTQGSSPEPPTTKVDVSVRIWDYSKFLDRLATFTAWFGKPKTIKPVECAARGWVNSRRDELECKTCGVKLKHEGLEMHSKERTKWFENKLNTAHEKYCVWDDVDPNTVAYLIEKHEKEVSKRKARLSPGNAGEGVAETEREGEDRVKQVEKHLDNVLGI